MPKLIYSNDFFSMYQAIDPSTCKEITSLFDGEKSKWHGKTVNAEGSKDVEADVKSSYDFEIRDEGVWSPIFKSIHPIIEECMAHYIAASPILRAFQLNSTGYKIQMYPKNEGYFKWHADSLTKSARNRVMAMVCYLNDVEKGGETEFYHQKLKFTPKAGHLLLFPTGWNFMHRGNMPESEAKYIISSFVEVQYKDNGDTGEPKN